MKLQDIVLDQVLYLVLDLVLDLVLAQVSALALDTDVNCLPGLGAGRKEPLVKLSFNFVKVFTWVAAPSLLCNFIYEVLADKRIVSQLTALS